MSVRGVLEVVVSGCCRKIKYLKRGLIFNSKGPVVVVCDVLWVFLGGSLYYLLTLMQLALVLVHT